MDTACPDPFLADGAAEAELPAPRANAVHEQGPRVGFVEWPDGITADEAPWDELAAQIRRARLDLLVTNELPFGNWVAAGTRFDLVEAAQSVSDHKIGLSALARLGVPAIISSRPVWRGDRLQNQSVLLRGGEIRGLGCKRHLPEEPGWREQSWFRPGSEAVPIIEVGGLKLGILLGTELMFIEEARALGRSGADLIVVPRASGPSPIWNTAGAMAAIVSGSYVVSSNRSGGSLLGVCFGGGGYAYSPAGTLISKTDEGSWLKSVHVDRARCERQKRRYPCYVGMPEGLPAEVADCSAVSEAEID